MKPTIFKIIFGKNRGHFLPTIYKTLIPKIIQINALTVTLKNFQVLFLKISYRISDNLEEWFVKSLKRMRFPNDLSSPVDFLS